MCISYMAKSLSSVEIMFLQSIDLPPLETCAVVALLNSSLQANPSLTIESNIFSGSKVHLNFLSRALRRDPDVVGMNFRRSQSLYDLTTQKIRAQNYIELIKPVLKLKRMKKHPFSWDSSRRRHSCPDLLEMQSLHNMHPQLHQIIGTKKCYFHVRTS